MNWKEKLIRINEQLNIRKGSYNDFMIDYGNYLKKELFRKEKLKIGDLVTIPKFLTVDPLHKQGQTGIIKKINSNGDYIIKFNDGKIGTYTNDVFKEYLKKKGINKRLNIREDLNRDIRTAIDKFVDDKDASLLLKLAHYTGNCKDIAQGFKNKFHSGQIMDLAEFKNKYNIKNLLSKKVRDRFNLKGHLIYVLNNEVYDPVMFVGFNIPSVKTSIQKYTKLITE